ncbi:hypothetical protein PAPYR_12350 [Paratrimastix pyriformis]|uniref:Uncharacterized protein n=1 Tax=Paratrimastix pyriformis TaxID=342808 RepID=A0ABQ8U1Z9_9EUKA|nr:hypothetical protein PAPYR_12350 [Paratrimastix pyriformis]
MLLIINPYFKLDYHFNCAPWIDGFPHSDTVCLHIQLLLYSSSETCHYHSSLQMICIQIHLVCLLQSTIHYAFNIVLTVLFELVYHLLKVIAYILNW